MKKISFYALLFIFLATAGLVRGADIPYLTGRVVDNAHIIADSTFKSLENQLKAHEDATTNQIVILTVPSLEGESIEDFANKVFNVWKLGKKDKDNGILIVVVPGEHRMRIEVGYGLEGSIPDVMAGRIIQNIMAPRFRNGDFNGGITDGVKAVLSVLEGKELPPVSNAEESSGSSPVSNFADLEKPQMPVTTRILIGAFIFGILGLFTVIGIFTPGAGWFLYLFLIPFWSMFPVAVLGSKGALICFITYLVLFPAAKLYLKTTPWYKKANKDMKKKGKASIGGFMFSGGGSGGSWSSGGSSGGFSGGGGSSGGGGASGSW